MLNLDLNTAGILLTIIGSVWTLAWWLSRQFGDVRSLVFSKIEQVQRFFSEKLDQHEAHDVKRFDEIQDDLWAIKLRNAAKDGRITIVNESFDQKAKNS